MLLHRSVLSKVCLLLAICIVNAQYEYGNKEKKQAKEEEEVEERDYEKIFAEETAPALNAAAEEAQSPEPSDYAKEFEEYFKPAHIFGESNNEDVKEEAPEEKKKEHHEPNESKKEAYSVFNDSPLKDFFAESEKRQEELHNQQTKNDEEVIRPGPSYISHQVPARYRYHDEEEDDKSPSASEDAPAKKNKQKSTSEPNFEEGRVEKNLDDYTLPHPLTFEPFKASKPKVDYNTGKSSSTVSQTEYPSASGYNKPTAAASTPYEKYSFRPAEAEAETEAESEDGEDYEAENSKFFDSIRTAPYNPTYKRNSEPRYETQSTENSPSQLQGKGCRKVSSSNSKDDMNCFVCENPKTNAKYTQCSYSTQKKPVDYYEGNAAKYTVPQKEEASSYRYKRFASNDEDDPYTYIRNRARKASHDGSGVPSDYGAGFNYEAEHYDESKPELTYSEQHSEEIKKNPENCKKVDRKGMTCTVCQDPKTGGNFEQCSYTSKPKEKKYAYVTEKKFDNDEPQETHVVSQSKAAESNEKEKSGEASKQNTEIFQEYGGKVNQEKSPKKQNEQSGQDYEAKPSEKKEEDDYEYHFKHIGTPSYTDSLYKGSGSDNVDKKKKVDDFSDFDEYRFKYFPELGKQESGQESRHEPVEESFEIPVPEATKQNVETVLAEFTKKDRSNCKKAQKKGMTCYLCVDKNNIQHEECMYVQESKPETKHVAYHESKATEKAKASEPEKAKTDGTKQETKKEAKQETKQETKQESKGEAKQESKQESTQASKEEPTAAESNNRYFFINVPAAASDMEVAASDGVGSYVRYKPEEPTKKSKKKSSDKGKSEHLKPEGTAYDSERIDDKAEPTIKTPEEFVVGAGEGAFSDETKAVYSKELGVQLPKYMLEKSEFEKEFDAFSGSF